MKHLTSTLAVLLLVTGISLNAGCGNKDALYLPSDAPAAASDSDSTINK